jgi:uncharacterized membrane protein YhiD involved in acid resistance
MPRTSGYFKNYTTSKGILYTIAIIYVTITFTISILQPFIFTCKKEATTNSDFENPGYAFYASCHHHRQAVLFFLTPEECTLARRLAFASIFGALIGWERRQSDRPAGIRTMAVVSLGACLFSICGTFAFLDGPMGWDASRISAAIPSGVGFLGAGIIWKQNDEETNTQSVHGLTTAASLWLSAAVGIACSGELYVAASFAIAVMMILLRFGPRIFIGDEETNHISSERDVVHRHDSGVDLYDEESPVSSLPSENLSHRFKGGYNSLDTKDPSIKEISPLPMTPSKRMGRRNSNTPSIRE